MNRAVPACLLLSLAALPAAAQTTLTQHAGSPSSQLAQCAGGHDLNGDGRDDLVLGASFDDTAGVDSGAVFARSGADGSLLWARYGNAGDYFGRALALSPDLDGDGVWDVVIGAPSAFDGSNVKTGAAYLHSGRTGARLATFHGASAGDAFGTSVAANFDWDKDGFGDIAAGAPFHFSTQGQVLVFSGLNGQGIGNVIGNVTALFGISLAGVGDMDGDGYRDLAMGATNYVSVWGPGLLHGKVPNSGSGFWIPALADAGDTNGDGLDELLIGDSANSLTQSGAGQLSLFIPNVSCGPVAFGSSPGEALGSSVANLGDLDGDGWDDWAVGATAGVSGQGHVRVISGRFKQELYRLQGPPATYFGAFVTGAGDVNGDGFPDLAVGDSTAGASSNGAVTVFSAFGPGFVNYCTAGSSSSGCQAQIAGSGTPSATQAVPFTLTATGVEGNTRGLFFYGWNGRQAGAWGNGTSLQCVQPPVKRTPLQDKTGSAGQCDGSFTEDLNAYWLASSNKNPGAGAVAQAQYWYRDPQSTSNQTTSLSNAIEFAVAP